MMHDTKTIVVIAHDATDNTKDAAKHEIVHDYLRSRIGGDYDTDHRQLDLWRLPSLA